MKKTGSQKILLDFFSEGHTRSIRAKKNILGSFIIRGLNIIVALVLVPLTIHYLDPTRYGIWITLSSIIGWFGFFDIGLGNGLRNHFAQALATGDHELARTYVSTTYAILLLVVGVVLTLFFVINPLLDWGRILNVDEDIALQSELGFLASIVFTFFCLQFICKLIATILLADQRSALAAMLDLSGKVIVLLLIFCLTQVTEASLLYLGLVVSGVPVIVLVVSTAWFFSDRYVIYRPAISHIDFTYARGLLNLGAKFFVIQISALLLYQTNNIIISQLYGPAEVTPYNVAFQYFSVLAMILFIVVAPFWSAFTEAWERDEIEWIRRIMKKLFQFWAVLFFLGGIMLAISPWVYQVWVGQDISVSYGLSSLVFIWTMINGWNGIFSNLLNGLGKIKLQLYLGLGSAIVNVPLAIILGLEIGVEGILLANIIVTAVGTFIYPIQYKKILYGNAIGIWAK